MGAEYRGRCNACGTTFTYKESGGFCFHVLRCDTCGRSKMVEHDKPDGPDALFSRDLSSDLESPADEPAGPIDRGTDVAAVERKVRPCRCGGRYRFDAPPRCPRCRSTDIDRGEITLLYD